MENRYLSEFELSEVFAKLEQADVNTLRSVQREVARIRRQRERERIARRKTLKRLGAVPRGNIHVSSCGDASERRPPINNSPLR